MTKTKYQPIRTKQANFPPRDLLEITPEGRKPFHSSLQAFGPATYRKNIVQMSQTYSHPETGKQITFRPPTTAESVYTAAYDFKNKAKPEILDPNWLQLGYIVRTSEGVYANPPRNLEDKTDEKALKLLLNKGEKVNGIWLCENDFAFIPYETFKRGPQSSQAFSSGGLARGLEYSKGKKAGNFTEISAEENYKDGVEVWGFGQVKSPILKETGLLSGKSDDRLFVDGNYWSGGGDSYAFGVLE